MTKTPISATIEDDLIRWISNQLKDKKRYRNKSHLIETAIELLKEDEKKKGKEKK